MFLKRCQPIVKCISNVNNSNGPPLEHKLNLVHEVDRLKTFANCSVIPITVKDDLATLGFYYEEHNNAIKCSNCINFVSNIDSKEYLNHSCLKVKPDGKNCDTNGATTRSDKIIFTIRKPSRNSSSDFIGDQKSKWPHYSNYNNRITSFNSWKNWVQKPEELSAAGLFHVGCDDRTVCFHCGIGIRSWAPRDEPWVEHARFSPKCNFVLQVKGKEFIEKSFEKTINRTPQENMADAQELLQDLLEKLATGQKKKNFVTTTPVKNNPTEQSSMDERYLCKICYSNESDSLFLPCNHLCSCYDCAMKLKTCVICRSPIQKITKIYRS